MTINVITLKKTNLSETSQNFQDIRITHSNAPKEIDPWQ